jgi:polyisoprenoid-binding protein YceI
MSVWSGGGSLDGMTTSTPRHPAGAATGTWTVDASTRAGFAARNFGFRTVHGTIVVTAGTLEVGADGRPARFAGTLDPVSIDTGNPRRDKDLRGKHFLDVANHPRMEVEANQFELTTGGWRARAVLRVAGAETPLWIDGVLDDRSTAVRLWVTGTARLDLRDVGIRVPPFLVSRHVLLTISARLSPSP